MPYDKQSFLNGLAAGLSATLEKSQCYERKIRSGYGESQWNAWRIWTGGGSDWLYSLSDYDTFALLMWINTPSPLTIIHELWVNGEVVAKKAETIHSVEGKRITNVFQFPEGTFKRDAVKAYYTYHLTFLGPPSLNQNSLFHGNAYFCAYPKVVPNSYRLQQYPGSPENMTYYDSSVSFSTSIAVIWASGYTYFE